MINISTEKTILSDIFDVFEKQSTGDFPAWVNPAEHNLPDTFKTYIYPVNSWPVIINKATAAELSEICVKLPALIQRIPELYFNNDIKKIADYYFEGNEVLAQYALACHEKKIETGCRLDLTFSDKGFKVLEVNIGSSIGGWQVQSFEKAIRSFHPSLSDPKTSVRFHSENSQVNYINFLIEKTLEQVKSINKEVNIFIHLGPIHDDKKIEAEILQFFNGLLQEGLSKRGLKGKAYSDKLTALKLQQGKLYLEDIHIHSVLMFNLEEEVDVPPGIFRAFLMDAIYFPDHLGMTLDADKRNLGLIIELAENDKFSKEENELILKCIPWSTEVKKKDIVYQKQRVDLVSFLKENKDNMVIKSATGYQGKDVFIGKFSTSEEWDKAIEEGLKETDFIAQEYCDSVDFLAPNKQNDWTPHKLIWGAFGFGNKYGGVWVRMSEVENDVGVINSATGAVEAIVFEVKDL